MLGHGSRAGVVSTVALASGALLGLSVMAARSPWSPFLLERLQNFGRPTFHAGEYVPIFASDAYRERQPGDPDVDASTLAPGSLRPLTPEQAQAANLLLPFFKGPMVIPTMFSIAQGPAADVTHALSCMTSAIYYEARSEGVDGERAVAQVVLNRVRHRLFPKSVCGVVYQGAERPTGCQFSFACDGSLARPPEIRAWTQAQMVADEALHGRVFAPVGLATHYHTRWVLPYWAGGMDKLTQIGAHIFYRWSGGAGATARYAGRDAGGEVAPGVADVVPVVADTAPAPGPPLADTPAVPAHVALVEPAAAVPGTLVRMEAAEAPAITVAPTPTIVVAPDPLRPHAAGPRISRLATPSNW